MLRQELTKMPRMASPPPFHYPNPQFATQSAKRSWFDRHQALAISGIIAGCLLVGVMPSAAQYRSDTAPAEKISTESFISHRRGVTYEAFTTGTPTATLILLHGASGPGATGYRRQAEFFAAHGYRTLLLHYYDASGSKARDGKNYAAWADAVRDLVAAVRQASPDEKIYLVGYSLGASVALGAGSRKLPVAAIAEWYGSLPDDFFHSLKGMPPLLILHGERDANIPVINARQLIRLCSMAHFTCESHIYPDQMHGFDGKATADADERTLAFFAQH
jgi:dienelactone hydrolase